MLDDTELDLPEESQPEPPKRSGNQFLVVAGVLGAILLLSLIGIVVYALVILPEQQAAEPGLSAAELTGTVLAQVVQATNTVTATPTRTPSSTPNPPTNTPRPTNTPLISPTTDPATATVNALLTQAALAQTQAVSPTGASSTPGTPTATPSALPNSGFADDIGAPGLLAAAAALLIVVIMARRYRNAE